MSPTDARLTCRDCAQAFTFTVDERLEFASHGHAYAPSRCPVCRAERKARQEQTGGARHLPGFRDRREQPATSTICGACGKPTVVPFALPANRVAFCSACYQQRRAASFENQRR
jgi:CxxC-x17-CxxC domain-containing protein